MARTVEKTNALTSASFMAISNREFVLLAKQCLNERLTQHSSCAISPNCQRFEPSGTDETAVRQCRLAA
jgi:hypothetical protein